jgi:hypothetical protein
MRPAGPNTTTPDPATPACPPRAAPWRGALLGREQYINAASDLLGFDVRPLVTFADAGGRFTAPGVSLTALEVEERQKTAETIAAAAASTPNLGRLCDVAQRGEAACAADLIAGLATRAFRRPPDPDTGASLRALYERGVAVGGFATGVEWLVAGLLQAPELLYQLSPRAAAGAGQVVLLDDHVLASRLSFFLWNSPPDERLLTAAAAGKLRSPGGLAGEVARLLADPRAARMREDYYGSWLRLDQLDRVARDAAAFTPAVAHALRRSLMAGIHHLYQASPRIEALFGDSTLFADGALAEPYGLTVSGPDLQPVAANPDQRRGILTHPALLSVLAKSDTSDPVARGVFIQEQVLCQTLPDPPPNVPDLPALRPGLSTRQRLEQHRANPACAGCHQIIDPMGLALENYDGIGRYRTTDQGVRVDSAVEVVQNLDLAGKYASGIELLARLPATGTVRDCLVQRWFEYAVSRAADPAEACELDGLRARFRGNGDLIDLVTAIAQSRTFRSQIGEE